VYFLGFLPGFAYLGGMDRRLATPRRKEPRLAVPAGSLGIGGEQTGVYPSTSPGGWQLIGRTSLRLFDPARDPASLLLPGDTVRFVSVGESR
jgi:KipI family sensor histidine kinase inhibitor